MPFDPVKTAFIQSPLMEVLCRSTRPSTLSWGLSTAKKRGGSPYTYLPLSSPSPPDGTGFLGWGASGAANSQLSAGLADSAAQRAPSCLCPQLVEAYQLIELLYVTE